MSFPKSFLWGVSMSGFQFEMGGPGGEDLDKNTDWFIWVHDKRNIERKIVSGDLPEDGPDYWHLYREDHKLANQLGLNSYRLGVEWSRIFPSSTREVKVDVERNEFGRISTISAEESFLDKLEKIANTSALNHYREILKDIISRDMRPIVCLNHFTLPLWIHDPLTVRESGGKRGPRGWLDEETIVEFWKYVAYTTSRLGDLVDHWVTFNEPNVVAEAGYLFPSWGFPPGLNNFRLFKKCVFNLITAHARAYDAIKQFDKVKAMEDSRDPAEVGIIVNIIPMEPLHKEKDLNASELADHLHNRLFIEAVADGWIDENLNLRIDRRERDRDIGRRIDWIGVNYYTRNVVRGKRSILARVFAGISTVPEIVEGYGNSCKPNDLSKDGHPTSDFGWEIYPSGLSSALRAIAKYGKPLYVTENGIADSEDKLRPRFIVEHLRVLEEVIKEEKLDVRGYFHWSLIDNYEWASGFKMKFGLCHVDLKTKERRPRKSYEVYREIVLASMSS
ncbi:MAG: beta-galactosidase BgaS [Nitrososphaeria archaeon]|nr:beta-galactosidase BgaS [Nitrososphaeria archaeon]